MKRARDGVRLALAAAWLCGCSSNVLVDGDAAHPPMPLPQDGGPSCAASKPLKLWAATSGTLFGDVLHIEGILGDGGLGYYVLELRATGPAVLVERRYDLLGGAAWTSLDATHYLHAQARELDVLYAADPRHAKLVGARATLGDLPFGWTGMAVTDHAATFCVRPDNQGVNVAERFDLTAPESPGAPV